MSLNDLIYILILQIMRNLNIIWDYNSQKLESLKNSDLTNKRVWIYIRVSTYDQTKWYSLEFQEAILRKHVADYSTKWWTFDEKNFYKEEGVSWEEKDRPQLNRLRESIINKRIDIVLIWKLDRLYRETEFFLTTLSLAKRYGVKIISSTELIDLDTHIWRYQWIIMQAGSEMEKANTLERTFTWRIKKAQDWYHVWGKIPYWYTKSDWKHKILVPIESEAIIINRIFKMYVNERKSQLEIAKILTSEWVPLKSSLRKNSWWKRSRNSEGFWRQDYISSILSRTEYIWIYRYWKTEVVRDDDWKKKSIPRPLENQIQKPCAPILEDISLFYKAKEMKEKLKVLWRKTSCDKYLLASLIRCWVEWCNCWFQWYKSSKWPKYYRCRWKTKWKFETACSNPQISWNLIEANIWSIVKGLITEPKNFQKQFEIFANTNSKISEYEEKIISLEKNKNERILEMEDLIISRVKNKIYESRIIFDNFISKLENDINILNTSIKDFQNLINSEKEKDSVIKSFDSISKLYKSKLTEIESNNDIKEQIIRKIIDKIVVTKTDIQIYFTFDKENPTVFNREYYVEALKSVKNKAERLEIISKYVVMFKISRTTLKQ